MDAADSIHDLAHMEGVPRLAKYVLYETQIGPTLLSRLNLLFPETAQGS
jgi:hypothetical protein